MPYPVMNTILDANYETGTLNYWLSSFTSGITDEVISVAFERFQTVPSPISAILFEHFHGAACRVGVEDTAVPHRQEAEAPAPVGVGPPQTARPTSPGPGTRMPPSPNI